VSTEHEDPHYAVFSTRCHLVPLRPSIFPTTLLSSTLSLCSSLNVRDATNLYTN